MAEEHHDATSLAGMLISLQQSCYVIVAVLEEADSRQ